MRWVWQRSEIPKNGNSCEKKKESLLHLVCWLMLKQMYSGSASLTSPRLLQERLMLLRTLFRLSASDRAAAVRLPTSFPPRWRWRRVQFLSRASPNAWPPSSLTRLRRRFRDKRVELLDKAWAMALAPWSLMWLSHMSSSCRLLLLSSLATALAPLSLMRLWEKSSCLSDGWSRRCFTSSRHFLSSTWLWWSLRTCRRQRGWKNVLNFDLYCSHGAQRLLGPNQKLCLYLDGLNLIQKEVTSLKC